jgi:uncharacterized metal-binding protein
MDGVLLLPCNGIGNPLSTISRSAAFRAAEILAERDVEVELLAVGRLLARLPEAVAAAQARPVAVIEGCGERCVTKMLAHLGVEAAAYVYLPTVMQGMGMGSRGLDRKYLGPKGRAIAEEVALAMAAAIEQSLEREAPAAEAAASADCCCEGGDE